MKQIFAALDTSCGMSLAVADESGNFLLDEVENSVGRDSDRILTPWLKEQLERCALSVNDITHWTVGIGPGSFAGLRCGIAMVKAISLVSGAAVRGVPSSVAIAAASGEKGSRIGILHEGRCGQVLLAVLVSKKGGWCIEGEVLPLNPEQLMESPYFCESFAAVKNSLAAPLPAEIQTRLVNVDSVCAGELVKAPDALYPWCSAPVDIEKSTTPLYVRQAVFVRPAALRAVQ